MVCPSCGFEIGESATFCTKCGVSLPGKHSTAKRFFKWSGIGCGGLLGLFIVLVIIAALATKASLRDDDETSASGLQTAREAFLAGSESGNELRAVGREFDDDFVQEAVSIVESAFFGASDKWIVSNSDVIAACEVYHQVGEARARGDELTVAEFGDILQDELGLEGSALMGAIQSGITGDSEAIVDFCLPIQAYGIGFIAASEITAELYAVAPAEIDAPSLLDDVIDQVPRAELRTDPQTAYHKGFLAGMDADHETETEHRTSEYSDASELRIRFVGDGALSKGNETSLAGVIERIQEGVVRVVAGRGSGSGFIIDESGVVVTNEHVVRGHRNVGVWLTDGRRYAGEVLKWDSRADLALVKIQSKDVFHAIAMGNPAGVRVGDEVLALGYPLVERLGNSLTATRGIISAMRTLDGVDLLQTDAAINPGNSGGPLINRDGNVIGVNTFRLDVTTDGRPVNSVGFAVSVTELQRVASIVDALTAIPQSATTSNASIIPSPIPAVRPTAQSDASTNCKPFCDWDFWTGADKRRVIAELDRGAKISAKSNRGLTPLHFAARSSGDSSVIALLLERGADVNATSNDGLTPLHAAASGNLDPSVIELLLDHGADIEARDNNDATPLHHAVVFVNEDPSVVKLLLDRGADVNARSKHGETPCQFAGWWITDTTVIRRLCR